MSYNGNGTFNINSTGQPVVAGTTISDSVFNAFTADVGTGLSTAICKDGQTTITANIPLSGYKITGMGLGTATTDAARVDNANALDMCEFRLTLTAGTPVTTADVTAAETVYMSPYRGNRIALYDGTNWYMRATAEISIDVPDATNCYDVFCYDNAGTATLELTAWTNETTRATALTLQNGVLVKTGALTRRYIGTFYCTTAGNGQTEDSIANRYLWNYYNRVARPMRVLPNANWAYTSGTIRQANGSTANQLNFVIGVGESPVSANVIARAYADAGSTLGVGIGLDSTTAYSTASLVSSVTAVGSASEFFTMQASYSAFPAVGKHYLAWLEAGAAGGNFSNTAQFGGIVGEILG